LEAQAAGCPCITTDIWALPEINNEEVGWLINVPKDKFGNGKINTNLDREFFSNTIENSLTEILTEILNNPSVVKQKGMKALERIKREHNPVDRVKRLEEIYLSAKC
ncbi:MAG: hypothetical protein MI784_16985, partial [Cytophagales bacterium]|nr:hypothetical protein [Cytophagales bacterium]